MRPAFVVLLVAACGVGDCPPLTAEHEGVRVEVTAVGGCAGATWRADVSFSDGRTQALAGDRDGGLTDLRLEDLNGDGSADIIIVVEPNRRFEFIRRSSVFFGGERN